MAYSSLPSTRRLSRNKVSVGEPADGSPPKKPEAGVHLGSSLHYFYYTLLFTLSIKLVCFDQLR